jgi:putative ABC transport system permease protein
MTQRTADADGNDLTLSTLGLLLRAELGAGIFGLKLFIACSFIAALLMGAVWMTGGGLTQALERNGYAILGGDAAITVVNTPLSAEATERLEALAGIAELSRVTELRSTAAVDERRVAIELKAVDSAYPLYGTVRLRGGASFGGIFAAQDGRPGAVVAPALLDRLDLGPGDSFRIGDLTVHVAGVLETEPDRLASGGFLVGPRVLIAQDDLAAAGLLAPGALADFRYRLRFEEGTERETMLERLRDAAPERGWELETPDSAGDRVRRTVARTTTFLGLAGLAAMAIGLTGAWAAATVWIGRRARAIALYRLSGATPRLVVVLHAVIAAAAGGIGIALGLAAGFAIAAGVVGTLGSRLHLIWEPASLLTEAGIVAAILILGLAGAVTGALSAAAHTQPVRAMRSGEARFSPKPRDAAWGLAAIAAAMTIAVVSLPDPLLAAAAALGLALAAGLLAAAGFGLARAAQRLAPRGFVGLLVVQGLAQPGATAMKVLAVGIGIAGIAAVLAGQASLERGLRAELPAKAPDLVLLDVQPDQVKTVRSRIDSDPDLGGLQANPFMRATILQVNGTPAEEALLREDKRWVIEGDRSFSWAAEATGAELLSGAWWPSDYDGPPLLLPEEDVAQAFDLVPGDEISYSVLGRVFTSEVVGVRKEYHRTFRPEYLMLASPTPFRDAPHSWIVTLQGQSDAALSAVIRDLAADVPNVTAIDVRRIVAQLRQVIDAGAFASFAIAGLLLLAGALTLAAVVAADVDGRRREALAFTLIGTTRREIALARLAESLALGVVAGLVGGLAGLAGGVWIAAEALRVPWAPGWTAWAVPLVLGAVAALSAGTAGGLTALPRGRGQVARHLSG